MLTTSDRVMGDPLNSDPPRARLCPCSKNIFSSQLCAICLRDLSRTLYPRSVRFAQDSRPLLAMSRYEGIMKDFVFQCKANPMGGLYPPQLEMIKQLSEHWASELRDFRLGAIVSVPGHPLRSRWQTDLAWVLATEISRELGIARISPLLKRRLFVNGRLYRTQKEAPRSERLAAVAKQYAVNSKEVERGQRAERPPPTRILLVDDVCTTGATLGVCAQRLFEHGYEVPAMLVLSKVERKL